MSKYIPPKLRKEQTEDEKLEESVKIVQESSDHHFPILGGISQVAKSPVLDYGAKALEWEIKARVDARMAEYKAEKERQEAEEIRITCIPNFNQIKTVPLPIVEEEVVEIKNEDEWTFVQPKRRKPKKEKVFEEELDYDGFIPDADDDETAWA